MKDFQPMLASPLDEEQLQKLFADGKPRYLSPKLDGIRACVRNGVVLSRKLKPIPSQAVQKYWGRAEFEGLDGELITGPANGPDAFNRTQSAVMSRSTMQSEINATHFHVFDCVVDAPFFERLAAVQAAVTMYPKHFTLVPQEMVHTLEDILAIEEFVINNGFEGVMVRSVDGRYKFGRSTVREGYLLKLKRFTDDEYEVTGFEERMKNLNELQHDERGYAKRSSHKDNKEGTGMLGAWLGRALTGPYKGKDIRVTPTGTSPRLDEVQHLRGSIRVFKYFPSGSKDLPRFPSDKGPRHD